MLVYRFSLKTVVSLEPLMDMELEAAALATINPFYTLDKIFISTSYASRSSEISRALREEMSEAESICHHFLTLTIESMPSGR